MLRDLLPRRLRYLRHLDHSDREQARALLHFTGTLIAILLVFTPTIYLFLTPGPAVRAMLLLVIASAIGSLRLLHTGSPRAAGMLLNGAIVVAILVTTASELPGPAPVRMFSRVALMVASVTLAALTGSRRLPLYFAALYSLFLVAILVILVNSTPQSSLRDAYTAFAIDGILALGLSGLLLFLMRRIYSRSLHAVSVRTRRQERYVQSLQRSEERFQRLADASFEAILIERNGQILETNRAFAELFGEQPDGSPPSLKDLVIAEDQRKLPLLLLSRNREVIELRCQRADGTPLIVEARSSVVRGQDGMVRSLVMRDVTAERDSRQLLEYQAFHDTLTGLANRKMLQRRADELLARGIPCALLLADLDRFKDINETLGHPYGDRILRRLGERLAESYPEPALPCRTGGDEFALLIPEPLSEESVLRHAEEFRDTIGRALAEGSLSLEIGASVGATLAPAHADNLHGLFRCADVAMYAAKQTRSASALYRRAMDLDNPRRFKLVADLSRMIRERRFDLHFQPRIRLNDGSLEGFEVLTRWKHPTLGAISPGELIPLAETGNLMGPLTLAVLEETLHQQRLWAEKGFFPVLAVNISARNLSDGSFPGDVMETLERFQAVPRGLELEITESAFLQDPGRAMDTAHKLSEAGFSLAIDDFGTGYSSLSYLADLPVQTLKIDLSFVREMLEKEKNFVLVNSTIQLAHALGLGVVAEGVESEETADALARMQCDLAQGYHFGHPRPASGVAPQNTAN